MIFLKVDKNDFYLKEFPFKFVYVQVILEVLKTFYININYREGTEFPVLIMKIYMLLAQPVLPNGLSHGGS